MKRTADLERRLRSLDALGQAVRAMKSLSAAHFREARAALDPARAYRQGVERIAALSGVGLSAGAGRGGTGPAGLLVVGAELGLSGGYSARVVDLASARRAELGEGPTLCVGRRAALLLARRGIHATPRYAAPTSAQGITDVLLRLAEDMLDLTAAQSLCRFDAVSARFEGIGAERPVVTPLLPMNVGRDSTRTGPRPRYVAPDVLAHQAMRELLYVTIHDLLLDALASEHGARLTATQAAEQWLEDRAGRLRRQLTAARREASTQEVIEIAAGARASRGRII